MRYPCFLLDGYARVRFSRTRQRPEKRTRSGDVYGCVRVRFLGRRVRTGTFFGSTGTQNLEGILKARVHSNSPVSDAIEVLRVRLGQ